MKKTNIKKIICIVLSAICMLTITYLSSQDAEKSTNLSKSVTKKLVEHTKDYKSASDKDKEKKIKENNEKVRSIAHFSLFFLLGILLRMTLKELRIKHSFIYTFLICVLYAVFDDSMSWEEKRA